MGGVFLLILLSIVSQALSDSCITYTFEEEYETLFSNTEVCEGYLNWDVGHFNETDVTDHHEKSTKYIYPRQELSCMKSFVFPMAPGGKIEVNIFMNSVIENDQVQVMVMELVPDDHDVFVGLDMNSPGQIAFVPGWHILTVTIVGNKADIAGYIAIWGKAALKSTVLVDSFRYIPPGTNASNCVTYPDVPEAVTSTETIADTTTKSSTVVTTKATTSNIYTTMRPTTLPVSNGTEERFWTPFRIKILLGISVLLSIAMLLYTVAATTCCCGSETKREVSVVVVK